MSFDLLDRPLVWIPVVWSGLVPDDKDGEVAKVVEHRIEVRVEIVKRDELERMFFPGEGSKSTTHLEAFRRLVKAWRKVVGHGQALEMNDENVEALLNVPSFGQAFEVAYLKACAGAVATREGNSGASPADGRTGGA